MTGEEYTQCLPQYLNVDVAASRVVVELKDLPANVTHVGGSSVVGKLKYLTASAKYVNVSGTEVGGLLKDLSASVTYVGVSGTSNLGDFKNGTKVGGELRDLPASVTYVDVIWTEVDGELKDLPASVTHVFVKETEIGGELRELLASATYVDVWCTEVRGELRDLPASVVNAVINSSEHGRATLEPHGASLGMEQHVAANIFSSYHSLIALLEQCTIPDSTTFQTLLPGCMCAPLVKDVPKRKPITFARTACPSQKKSP